MTRLEKDLAALAAMSPVQLRERWASMGAGSAPAVPAALLRRLLAQRLQERRYGALPVMVARELERMAGRSSLPAPVRQRRALTHGTRLIREWNGQTIAVEVMEGGFLWEDRTYRSLSEIARGHCQTNQNLVRNLKFEPTEVVWIDYYIRSFIEQKGPKCGMTRALKSD